MSTAHDLKENDWVTWDYTTFYRQNGKPVTDDNMHVVPSGDDWRGSIKMRLIKDGTPTTVWLAEHNNFERIEGMS